MALQVVDNNGEIVTENYTITNKKQAEAYRKKKEQDQKQAAVSSHRWVASYHDPIRNIIKDLTLIEAGAIVKLLPFLRFKSEGKLIKGGKPLKQVDIQKVLKRSKNATRTILDRLQELGVVQIVKDGRTNVFVINALFHTIGDTRNGQSFTKLYTERTSMGSDSSGLEQR